MKIYKYFATTRGKVFNWVSFKEENYVPIPYNRITLSDGTTWEATEEGWNQEYTLKKRILMNKVLFSAQRYGLYYG